MSYIGNQPTQIAFLTDSFSGDASTTVFTMSVAPANTSSVLVAIFGVLQDPSTYSVSGTSLTFSAAPPSGTGNISARYLGIPASGVTTTAYRTVTEFTATSGQVTFTPPSYTAGFITVYRNGVRLGSADITASNGTTVTLATGATSGDLITTESFLVSSVLNALPQSGGTIGGNLVVTGTETVPTITSPSSTALTLQSAGTTAVTIDTSQRVGIGTASPATKLNVYETGALDALVRISNANGGVYAASLNIDSTNATGSRYNSIYSSNNNTYQWSINGGGADSTMALCTGSSNTQRMVIDSSGRVTKAYQPAFDAYGTVGNQLFTTDTPMPLNSTTYNVGGHYSTSTYRFTAPVAGIYFFRAQAYKQASGNASRLRLYKNAADVRVYQYISSSDVYTHSITGIISLAAGDYVTCNFNSDGGGTNIYLADNHTNFSGYFLG